MSKYNFLIVGTGLYGATFNHLAKKAGYSCIMIDKRSHKGGNLYCPIQDGIPIHYYGAHIFHTSNKEIWDFVCTKCDMVPFINSPIANYNGEIYNLPFNMNTFSKLFGVSSPEEAKKIIDDEIKSANITNPKNLEEQAISLVGSTIYNKLIKEYTEKQWGRDCKELSPTIINRLPVRFTYDNNYFNDTYQGIPKGGYNGLIDNLIGDTEVLLNYNFKKDEQNLKDQVDYIIYTGPIDEYYNYCFGNLDWRTVRFEDSTLDVQNYQGNAVVNYTSHTEPYTRIIEHKHFDKSCDGYASNKTIISKEYSMEWQLGMEPYYPVNTGKNKETLLKYQKLADNETNVLFGGRLGTYKYYDMDDTIENAFNDFVNLMARIKK